jgi:hypothetical protein
VQVGRAAARGFAPFVELGVGKRDGANAVFGKDRVGPAGRAVEVELLFELWDGSDFLQYSVTFAFS